MAEYRLLIKSSDAKELDAAGTKADRLRIIQRIQALTGKPRPHRSEKLAGYADRYRIRQESYRIIYLVDAAADSSIGLRFDRIERAGS